MAADPLDDYIDRLRQRPNDFDPAVRDRLLAGAMGVIIAPATPCVARKLGQVTFVLDGVELPVRANIGIHTQPISFIGLPVVAVPVPLEPMPIGVQIIAAPWREDIALRTAYALQHMGVVAAPPPRGI
jgi:1-carboxybiuret hydrolase